MNCIIDIYVRSSRRGTRIKFLMAIVLLAWFIMGCALIQPRSTQTAPAARSSPVAATPQPTGTPLPTPTPLPTKSAAQVQQLDLSNARILRSDLPGGFVVFDLTTVGVDPSTLDLQGYKPENLGTFLSFFPSELIISFIVRAQSDADRVSIDALLDDPEKVLDMLGSQMGRVKEKETLQDVQVGDKAAGIRVLLVQDGSGPLPVDRLRAEVIAFRREMVVGVCASLYPDGQKPRMPASDLAKLLDERLKAALK